uniref:CCHC-type domain-containing protein n=1 Tax=Poecilia reticulata TaxID=8081 RepID=A0A3P9PUJ8_POERE
DWLCSANVRMVSLSQTEPRTITVLLFSEQVCMEDIKTWLQQRCTVMQGYEIRDEDGIRTGDRCFFVQLKRDLRTGETYHLPPVIQLGTIRGHVFYPGQPKVCHRCGSQQHLLVECQSTHCKNCKNYGHLTKNCPYPVNCNLCGERGHIFKTCPRSYANRDSEGCSAPLFPEDKTSLERSHPPFQTVFSDPNPQTLSSPLYGLFRGAEH